jgi:peptidoglycan/LPS O-acetylase OafA/YrhL
MVPRFLGYGSGQAAVGLFFILSGFLMAYLYAWRPLSFVRTYGLHRFARVVPLYLAVVGLSIAFPWAVFPIRSTGEIAEHLGFVYGIETLWTIPVEIQFYFLFALIWLAPRKVIPLLIGLQLVVAAALHYLKAPLNTLPFWLHFFLFGTACGLVWTEHRDVLKTAAEPYSDWGWAILAFAIVALPGVRHMAHVPVFTPIFDPVTILALATLFCGTLLSLGPLKGFAAPWACKLGEISYGVYLIHFPIVAAVKDLPIPIFAKFPLVLGSTIALATLSFVLFETPVRRWISDDSKRQVVRNS